MAEESVALIAACYNLSGYYVSDFSSEPIMVSALPQPKDDKRIRIYPKPKLIFLVPLKQNWRESVYGFNDNNLTAAITISPGQVLGLFAAQNGGER